MSLFWHSSVILQKKVYKIQAEAMLVTHVFPEFQSPQGYLRAMVRIIIKSNLLHIVNNKCGCQDMIFIVEINVLYS